MKYQQREKQRYWWTEVDQTESMSHGQHHLWRQEWSKQVIKKLVLNMTQLKIWIYK